MTNPHEARTAISALEALTADVLKVNDVATLDRLQELAARLAQPV